MLYRKLLDCGFKSSVIGFGGASISGHTGGYGFGDIDDLQSQKLIEHSVELGVNLFDTAPIYGFGQSEIRLGKYLKKYRDKVKIISKSGVSWHDNKRVNMTNDPVITKKMLESSLRNFQDHIDIYMVHWPDPKVDIRFTLEVLQRAKEKGLISHIGLSNTNVEELEKSKEICRVEVVQSELNLFDRSYFLALKDYLQANHISFLSHGTFYKGILASSYRSDRVFEKSDCRSWAPWWKKSDKDKRNDVFRLRNSSYPVKEALSHNLYFPIASALVGYKSTEQLDEMNSYIHDLYSNKEVEEAIRFYESHY